MCKPATTCFHSIRRTPWRGVTWTCINRWRYATMSVRAPEPTVPRVPERFPLAARALRARSVRATAGVAAGTGATAASRPASRSANNWPLYLFLFLLPLQNLQTGYMPNFGGGLNFLNIMTAVTLVGALAMH